MASIDRPATGPFLKLRFGDQAGPYILRDVWYDKLVVRHKSAIFQAGGRHILCRWRGPGVKNPGIGSVDPAGLGNEPTVNHLPSADDAVRPGRETLGPQPNVCCSSQTAGDEPVRFSDQHPTLPATR
jgi:hypothetical protein